MAWAKEEQIKGADRNLVYNDMSLCAKVKPHTLCHSAVNILLVTYSISALIVSQKTFDVSCLGALAEKGVFGFLLTSVT